MRPAKYSQLESRAAAERVMCALESAPFRTGPELRAVVGWSFDDTRRLLWALVCTGAVVRGERSKPYVSYALPENDQWLAPKKSRPSRVIQQDWASMVTALAA